MATHNRFANRVVVGENRWNTTTWKYNKERLFIIIKFKFIPRSFYKNIQLRLTINIKLEIKIEVQNYNSKIMQFNYKNYRTN